MEMVLSILAHWVVANLLAAVSLILLFTRFRSHAVAIALAVVVGAHGTLLSIGQGFPATGILPIHLLSWFPVLVACLSIVVWYRTRTCPKDLANPAATD